MQDTPGHLTLLQAETTPICIQAGSRKWSTDPKFRPSFSFGGETVFFDQATAIAQSPYKTGVGEGVVTRYEGFPGDIAAFETIVYIPDDTNRLVCTFVPLRMPEHTHVNWPGTFIADEKGSYAVITNLQGYLLPSDWPEEAPKLPFNGQMSCCTAYMPWFGMVAQEGAYLCCMEEPWDMRYDIEHPAGGPTRILLEHLPSLGKQARQRTVTFTFLPEGSDYVGLCNAYRDIAQRKGIAITLREKSIRLPSLERLIGASVMHVPTKSHVTEGSSYYDKENPEKNDSLTPFAAHEETAKKLKGMGLDRVYLHLDGWGDPGYDNKHPDYLPACVEAGGWEGLKSLQDTLHSLGYLFGLHDQYRDYYLDADTYDPDNAVLLADGTLYEMARWAGGKQNYLCSALAPAYVRRNFEALFAHGIMPDATYLDVFTCNEPDECINPRHVVTRAESLQYRKECFDFLIANGILPSSEEANDWAMQSLVFCHWAPYAKGGIPVPLFNLVYHDCFLIPWMLEYGQWGTPEGQHGFLHALLNGGLGYVDTELDGSALTDNVERCKIVSALSKRVAHERMVSHSFCSEDRSVQRTVFSDGTTVTVDFVQNTYDINPAL